MQYGLYSVRFLKYEEADTKPPASVGIRPHRTQRKYQILMIFALITLHSIF